MGLLKSQFVRGGYVVSSVPSVQLGAPWRDRQWSDMAISDGVPAPHRNATAPSSFDKWSHRQPLLPRLVSSVAALQACCDRRKTKVQGVIGSFTSLHRSTPLFPPLSRERLCCSRHPTLLRIKDRPEQDSYPKGEERTTEAFRQGAHSMAEDETDFLHEEDDLEWSRSAHKPGPKACSFVAGSPSSTVPDEQTSQHPFLELSRGYQKGMPRSDS
ncbi:hypothetical protein BHE74_00039892 [Ensete ventricosum]|nr:hypothetical protein BHE74_00039892 [Ensete ventricosum]